MVRATTSAQQHHYADLHAHLHKLSVSTAYVRLERLQAVGLLHVREVSGAAPSRPQRIGTSQCWPILRRHWLVVFRFLHILGRSWSEQNCAFGALLRPGQQTVCAIVKVDNGGDGHFQAKAAVQCLISFSGFLPDQPQTQSSNFCKHYQCWQVTDFPKGVPPGFPTPLASKYKDHSATLEIAMQQHHHRSTFVALPANCILL
jgi:hypothetical protein